MLDILWDFYSPVLSAIVHYVRNHCDELLMLSERRWRASPVVSCLRRSDGVEGTGRTPHRQFCE